MPTAIVGYVWLLLKADVFFFGWKRHANDAATL